MIIFIGDGLMLNDSNSFAKGSFFSSVDRYWGNYDLRKHFDYDDNTLIEDDQLHNNIMQISQNSSSDIGLGINIIPSIQKANSFDKKLTENSKNNLFSEVISKQKLEDYINGQYDDRILYIIPQNYIVKENLKEGKYCFLRVGENEIGDYVVFLHTGESESHNPIRIPGGK